MAQLKSLLQNAARPHQPALCVRCHNLRTKARCSTQQTDTSPELAALWIVTDTASAANLRAAFGHRIVRSLGRRACGGCASCLHAGSHAAATQLCYLAENNLARVMMCRICHLCTRADQAQGLDGQSRLALSHPCAPRKLGQSGDMVRKKCGLFQFNIGGGSSSTESSNQGSSNCTPSPQFLHTLFLHALCWLSKIMWAELENWNCTKSCPRLHIISRCNALQLVS